MPSILTRSPRRAAITPQPEEQDAAATASNGQPIGTTGGLIPQQAGTWDQPPQPLSADPRMRAQQSVARAEDAFAEKQRQTNPFVFSNDIRKLADVGGRPYIRAAIQQGDQEFAQQQQAARQQQASDVAAYNSRVLAGFKARGQQYYTDPESKRLMPVVDEAGRALYHETPWEATVHPKTGAPVMGKRDRFGQPQYKEMPIVASEDPTDSKMYYKSPDGQLTEAGNIEDLLAHPSYNVRRQALAANTRRTKATIQNTLAPLKELSETAQTEYQSAQNERDALQQQIQQASQLAEETVGNDAQSNAYRATAAQLQAKLNSLNEQLGPKGELYARRNAATRDYAMARRQSVLNVYKAQDMEMAARLKAEGKDPATDPAYLANRHMIEQIEGQAQPSAPTAVAQAAPLAESIEPYAMARRGEKSIGGVSLQQMAQRFGGGQGDVAPDSLLRINARMREIDETLANPDSKISGKLRQSLQEQRDYLGNLYDSRFGRLPEDQQGRVKEANDEANRQAGYGILRRYLSAVHEEGSKPEIGAGGVKGELATIPRLPNIPGYSIQVGALNSLGKAAAGLTSKENMALLIGTAGVGKIVQRLLSGGFGASMLRDAYNQAPEVWNKLKDPNVPTDEKAEAVGDIALSLLLGTAAAKHALKGAPAGTKLTQKQAEAAFQELMKKADREQPASPPKTPAEAIAGQFPESGRSAEDVAGIFERNPPQVDERQSSGNARESAAAILEQEARQQAQQAAEGGAVPLEQAGTPEELAAVADARSTARAERVAQEQAGGPPPEQSQPVGRTPEQLVQDRRAYDAIQAQMKALTDAQGMDAVNSPEYQRLWAASEQVKNRNGGYVPEPTLGQEPAATQAVAGEGAQGRTGPEESVVSPSAQNIERMAREGKSALQIAARTNSNTAEIQRIAKENGIAIPLKGSRKPDIVMQPKMEEPNRALQIGSPEEILQRPSEGTGETGGQRERVEPVQQGAPPARAKEAAQPEAVQQEPLTPERTAELRRNNADIEQRPVAQMTRAEKRAELDAGGVKEYNGKPLDEISPAELSAAVGKLRRGELTGDTKLTTDKIIEKIKAAKIDTKGKAFDVTGAAAAEAWNRSLDLAILGLKAGRPIEQIVRLAIDHYKAKHEGWTKDDVDRLESAIRESSGTEAAAKKSAISSVTEKLEKVIGKGGDPALRDEISARRDAGDNIAGIRATEARSEISSALDKIAPETTAQKAARYFNAPGRGLTERDVADNALRFYIEAENGNAAKLDAMRDKIANSAKADPKWAKRALEAIDYAKKNGEKLSEAARAVRKYMGDQLTAESEVNLPVLERKNYVPRYQDVEEAGILEPKGGKGAGVDSHKVRQYETMADSIAAGVDPKTLSTVDSVTNRVDNGMRAVGVRKFYDTLLNGKTESGEAMMVKPEEVKRADGSTYYQPPDGYKIIDTPTGKMAVKEEYQPLVKALTSPSFLSESTAGRALLKTAAAAKTTTLLLDTFHLGRIAMQAAALNASHPEGWKLGPRFSEGLNVYENSPQQLAKMASEGQIPKDKLGEILQNKKILEQGLEAGYNTGRVADAIHQDFLHNLPGFGGVNKFIFQQFQRGAMSDAFIMEFKRAKLQNPEMPDAQVARNVAKDLNTRFGNIGRQGWIKSATGRDLARLLFLAPQWNEGLIKSEIGGVKQLAKGAANVAQGKDANIGALGRSFATMAIGTFAAAQILNQASRGTFTWENPEEGWEAKISGWIPDKVGGSSGFFFNPLGITAETAHLLAKGYERAQGGPAAKGLAAVDDYLRSRESALARPFDVLRTRRDSLGRTIKPDDLPKEVASAAIPAPISGGSAFRVAKGLATGGKTEEYPGEFQKQAMQSFGVRTDRAPSPEDRMHRLAAEFLSDKGKEANAPSSVGDFDALTAAVRRNNPDDVKSEVGNLLEKRSADDLEKYYKQWMNRPFAGSHKLEMDFLRTLNTEQRQQYAKARAERKRIGEAALRAIRQIPAGERAGPFKLPK